MFPACFIMFIVWLVGKGFFKSSAFDWLLFIIILLGAFQLFIVDNIPQ